MGKGKNLSSVKDEAASFFSSSHILFSGLINLESGEWDFLFRWFCLKLGSFLQFSAIDSQLY